MQQHHGIADTIKLFHVSYDLCLALTRQTDHPVVIALKLSGVFNFYNAELLLHRGFHRIRKTQNGQ